MQLKIYIYNTFFRTLVVLVEAGEMEPVTQRKLT
jgi:hypothetical protein